MAISDLIENELGSILEEWEDFAKSRFPVAQGLTREELRDHGEQVLRHLVEHIRAPTPEQHNDAKPGPRATPSEQGGHRDPARLHAAERLTEGFTISQLVGEYGGLRERIARRWRAEVGQIGDAEAEELARFNAAIDKTLVEAVGSYHTRIEDARDLLIGVLAHDLRGPLGAVLAALEVMLHDEKLSAEQIRLAVRARNSATRMGSMIADLLDFTRARLGTGLPIATTKASMRKIVNAVLEEQTAVHPETRFVCELSGNLTGQWDSSRIEQLIGNLVDNAAKHAATGTPVTLAAKALDGQVVVSIHNNGIVIPPETQQVIFDPFRRAVAREAAYRDDSGLGLGLYIVRQIAAAHNGRIELESAEEKGTTFTVLLPRERGKAIGKAGAT